MTTIIQATNINSAADPAVSLANGDYYYELAGVGVTTTGSTAVGASAAAASITAEIHGSLFGSTVGISLGSGEVIVASTGNVSGSFYGINFQGGYAALSIDGQVYGHAVGILNSSQSPASPTQLTYLHVGETGTVTANDTAVLFSGDADLVVDGTVSGQNNGIDIAPISGTSIQIGATASISGNINTGLALRASSAAANIAVAGTVYGGSYGIQVQATPATTKLTVAKSGLVTGQIAAGISIVGSHVVMNDGTIDAVGSKAIGVSSGGGGIVVNTGIISAGSTGLFYNDATMADMLTTVNVGTVSGATFSYDAGTNSAGERFVNQGVLNGDVRLGSHGASSFINAGILNGGVTLGNGPLQLCDSTLGTISGVITCGAEGDIVIAGQSGGMVVGGLHDDILYANPTQTAADNRAHTTLDGGTGSNALYGGGAYTTFIAGDTNGGYDQVWGGASQMAGVADYTNNTLSYANVAVGKSVYVDLLNGHNAYVNSGPNNDGTYTFEDSIVNVPNVIGSKGGDLIVADNGTDRIQGGGSGDGLYAGGGADTFVYTGYSDSNVITGYDTIIGFKLGIDKIDLSALATNGAHIAISTAGLSNTFYVEQTPGAFNAATDLAMIVNTTTTGGLNAADFVF